MRLSGFSVVLALLLRSCSMPIYAEELSDQQIREELIAIYGELETAYRAHQELSSRVAAMSEPLLTASDGLERLQVDLQTAGLRMWDIEKRVSEIERVLKRYAVGGWILVGVAVSVVVLLILTDSAALPCRISPPCDASPGSAAFCFCQLVRFGLPPFFPFSREAFCFASVLD